MPHPLETPAKKQSKWSAEENARIIELRGANMKWEDISKRLPGRSAISCRLHYQNFLERKAEWDEEKDNKLSRLYDRFKREMWEKIAADLHMPWRAVEARHWELGAEGLAMRAGVPLFASSSGATADTPTTPSGLNHSRNPSWRPAYTFGSPPLVDPHHQPSFGRPQGHSPHSQLPPPHQDPTHYSNYKPYSHYPNPHEQYQPAPLQHQQPPPPPQGLSRSGPVSPAQHHAPPSRHSDSPTSGRWIPPRYTMHQPPPPTTAPPSAYAPLPQARGEKLPPMRLLTEPREYGGPLESLWHHARPPTHTPLDSVRPSPWGSTPGATPVIGSEASSRGSGSR